MYKTVKYIVKKHVDRMLHGDKEMKKIKEHGKKREKPIFYVKMRFSF